MTQRSHHFAEAPLPGFDIDGLKAQHASTSYRTRLRDRFMQGGADAVPDYELLQLVLFRAIARRHVHQLADRLLAVFGDFSRVISASPDQLGRVHGVGEAVIRELKIVEAAAHRMAQTRVLHKEVLSSWDALLGYCKTRMSALSLEQFRVLFLDRKNILIADEALQTGTVDHVPVYPREILKRALELNACALILVHNHPSGDTSPSEADIAMTGQIATAAMTLGITLHDHLIIGRAEPYSFRSHGLI